METIAARLAQRYPLIAELATKRLAVIVIGAAAAILATNLAMFAVTIATAKNYVTIYGPIIGGDFIVFDTAASGARSGDIAGVYDAATFSEMLAARFDFSRPPLLSWQYPPTMFLLLWPLAFVPYLTSYAVWVAMTGAAFAAALRNIWSDGRALFLGLSSPAVFQSLVTGQTGFLTAALLSTAGLFAQRRPVLAGFAAGLLTVKPQLGLLVPIAFAAAGCWRAFAAAAVTAIALAGVSIAAFSLESWRCFIDAAMAHGDQMGLSAFPHHKLISVFGGATMLGLHDGVAMSAQAAASLTLAAFVAIVWRRTDDALLRMAALCAAAPMATPYAFYYEAALLVPPTLAIARIGAERGWLRGERLALAALWAAAIWMPGPQGAPGLPWSFAVALGVLAAVGRRSAPLFAAPRTRLA